MVDYEEFLAGLRRRRDELEKEYADVDAAITAVERLAGVRPSVTPKKPVYITVPTKIGAETFANLTMPQAIQKFFSMVTEPQTTRQVIDGLIAGGMKVKGNVRGHVYNTLHRLSQDGGPFVHQADARWSLREWSNPAAKNLFSGGQDQAH
jgi:hypothetical protein